MVNTPGSVRKEISPTSTAYCIYSFINSGYTSIFDNLTIPSGDIGSLAHMPGFLSKFKHLPIISPVARYEYVRNSNNTGFNRV